MSSFFIKKNRKILKKCYTINMLDDSKKLNAKLKDLSENLARIDRKTETLQRKLKVLDYYVTNIESDKKTNLPLIISLIATGLVFTAILILIF